MHVYGYIWLISPAFYTEIAVEMERELNCTIVIKNLKDKQSSLLGPFTSCKENE